MNFIIVVIIIIIIIIVIIPWLCLYGPFTISVQDRQLYNLTSSKLFVLYFKHSIFIIMYLGR